MVRIGHSDQIVTTPSLFSSTVHVATGIHENCDLDEWTTFDDHGRPVKKWTPLEPSAGCYLVMHTRTDLLDDLGCAFKSSMILNRLFVGGIPLQLREHKIVELFSKFGKVKHVIVLKTKYSTSKVLLNSLLSPPFHRTVLCR